MDKDLMLVTGASGFIASNFIRMYQDKFNIVGIDKKPYTARRERNDFKFYKVDLLDKGKLEDLFYEQEYKYVVNFAAEANVDDSITNPEKHVKNNIVGTLNLIDICREHDSLKRFHQVSTDEVYGDAEMNQSIACTEEDACKPNNPYSVSKASADMMIQTYGRMYDFPYTISRCTNNFGPYQTIDKLIPRMITRCLNNESLTVHGDGSYMRDWLHVEDHCRAIYNILVNGKEKEIYNVSGEAEYSNIEIIGWIADLMNYPKENIVFQPDRLGNDRRYYIDSTKIQQELGHKNFNHIDVELQLVCDWYMENAWWWMPQLEVYR